MSRIGVERILPTTKSFIIEHGRTLPTELIVISSLPAMHPQSVICGTRPPKQVTGLTGPLTSTSSSTAAMRFISRNAA